MSDIPEPVAVASRLRPPGHFPPRNIRRLIRTGYEPAVILDNNGTLIWRGHRPDPDNERCLFDRPFGHPVIAGGFRDDDKIEPCSGCGIAVIVP